jgi:hypothetical protein
MAPVRGRPQDAGQPSELSGAVRYRFVATATPVTQSAIIELLPPIPTFLGVMDVGEIKTQVFQAATREKADELTIHSHKEAEWWLWVSTWSVWLQRPSDLCRGECNAENIHAAA